MDKSDTYFKSKAIQRAEEDLNRSSKLENIEEIILNLQKENTLLYSQIDNYRTQLVLKTRDAVNKISNTHVDMDRIRNSMESVKNKGKTNKKMIKDYENIKLVQITSRNVKNTLDLLKMFSTIEQNEKKIRIIFIQEWLDIRTILKKKERITIPKKYIPQNDDEDQFNDKWNLTTIQKIINKYTEMKYDARFQLKSQNKEMNNISRKINFVEELEKDFQEIFEIYVSNLMHFALDYEAKIEMIGRVIKRQELFEKKLRKKFLKNPETGALHIEIDFRNYKELFQNQLTKSIQQQFGLKNEEEKNKLEKPTPKHTKSKSFDEVDEGDAELMEEEFSIPVDEVIKKIETTVKDLKYFEEYIDPCFPPEYEVGEYFIRTVYQQTHRFIQEQRTNRELSISDKLEFIHWLTFTYPKLFEQFEDMLEVSMEEEESDKVLQDLTNDFLNETTGQLTTWSRKIVKLTFSKKMQVDENEGEPVYTKGPIDLFNMLTQILEPIIDKKLVDLCYETTRVLKAVLTEYTMSIYRSFVDNSNSFELRQFVPIINDFSRIKKLSAQKKKEIIDTGILKDNTNALEWMDETSVPGSLPTLLEKRAEDCLNELLRVVRRDLQPYLEPCFTDEWLKKSSTPKLLKYFQKAKEKVEDLERHYLKKLNIERFIVGQYVLKLYMSKLIFDKAALKQFSEDIKWFGSIIGKNTEYVEALQRIKVYLRGDLQDIIIVSGRILKDFPDFPKVLAIELINKSNSFKRKEIIEAVKSIFPKTVSVGKKDKTFFSDIIFVEKKGSFMEAVNVNFGRMIKVGKKVTERSDKKKHKKNKKKKEKLNDDETTEEDTEESEEESNGESKGKKKKKKKKRKNNKKKKKNKQTDEESEESSEDDSEGMSSD